MCIYIYIFIKRMPGCGSTPEYHQEVSDGFKAAVRAAICSGASLEALCNNVEVATAARSLHVPKSKQVLWDLCGPLTLFRYFDPERFSAQGPDPL